MTIKHLASIAAASAVALGAVCAMAGQAAVGGNPGDIPFAMQPAFVGQSQTCKSDGVKNVQQTINASGGAVVLTQYFCGSGTPGIVRLDQFHGQSSTPMLTAFLYCPEAAGGPSNMPGQVRTDFCKLKGN